MVVEDGNDTTTHAGNYERAPVVHATKELNETSYLDDGMRTRAECGARCLSFIISDALYSAPSRNTRGNQEN